MEDRCASCPLHFETGEVTVAPATRPRGCGTFPRPSSTTPWIVITPARLMLIVEYVSTIMLPVSPLPLQLLFSLFASSLSFVIIFLHHVVSYPSFSWLWGSHYLVFQVIVFVRSLLLRFSLLWGRCSSLFVSDALVSSSSAPPCSRYGD